MAQLQMQATAKNRQMIKRLGAKNVMIQVFPDELVQDENFETNPVVERKIENELLIGVVGAPCQAVTVDLRAYKVQMKKLKQDFKANNQDDAHKNVALLLTSLDKHKQVSGLQLEQSYKALGEPAIPDILSDHIRSLFA